MSDYHKKAKRRWRKAEWITGEGRYALLAHCRALTITLWPTIEEAEVCKTRIDETACGGLCWRNHEIIDLGV
jgi:hypothetical protein